MVVAGYWATHKWVSRNWEKTGVCEWCGAEGKTDWANPSHTYNRVRSEWVEICRRCHIRHDRGENVYSEMNAAQKKAKRERTHCRNGHDLTGARRDKRNGGRICNQCRRDYDRRRRAAGLSA